MFDIYTCGDQKWWYAQIAFGVALTRLVVWLYKKLSYKNIHINWVKRFVDDAGGRSLAKAMEYLNEIKNFEKEIN